MTDALAPPSAFVGKPNAAVIALIGTADRGDGLLWTVLVVLAAVVVYCVVVAVAWYLFLEYHDRRTPEERARHQAEDDAAQIAYLSALNHQQQGYFSPADRDFLRAMKGLAPDTGEGPKLLFVDWKHIERVYRVRPGGFVFVNGEYGRVAAYFKFRNWERLPFTWRDRHIYRKPR